MALSSAAVATHPEVSKADPAQEGCPMDLTGELDPDRLHCQLWFRLDRQRTAPGLKASSYPPVKAWQIDSTL
jgi:hypothetical protein